MTEFPNIALLLIKMETSTFFLSLFCFCFHHIITTRTLSSHGEKTT